MQRYRDQWTLESASEALDSFQFLLTTIDDAGIVRTWNRAAESIVRLDATDVIGRPLAEICDLVDLQGLAAAVDRARRTGETERYDSQFLRPDGSRASLGVSITPAPHGPEAGGSIVVVGADITAKREADERFALLADHAPVGIYIIQRGRIVYLNERAAATLVAGLGDEPMPAVHPDDREKVRRCAVDMLRRRRDSEYQYRAFDSAGRVHVLTERVAAIRYNGKRAVLGFFVDNTEQILMEQRLAQSQKLEAIGQLAAGIAHEINTPTQYVSDNVRFLESAIEDLTSLNHRFRDLLASKGIDLEDDLAQIEDELDLAYLLEEAPRSISQSKEGLERIATIVRSMKDFSHPSSESKTPSDVNAAIQSTVTVARNEWKYVADVDLQLDPELPLVPVYLDELNQAVLNLIVNAAQAIGDQAGRDADTKGTITIATYSENGQLEIRIGDNGPGIARELQHRIFEPFFTTKEVGKGTGQGLAITRAVVVEKHGGEFWVESEPGHGATFVMRIPMEAAPAIAA